MFQVPSGRAPSGRVSYKQTAFLETTDTGQPNVPLYNSLRYETPLGAQLRLKYQLGFALPHIEGAVIILECFFTDSPLPFCQGKKPFGAVSPPVKSFQQNQRR